MDTSTGSTQSLTQEQLSNIEENNKLLKQFSAYIEHLQSSSPEVNLPTTYMYDAFIVGVATAQQATRYLAGELTKELREMEAIRTLFASSIEGDS